ncbi:MAG: preprotein translocase subunit SecA [Candidatus Wildermuthbacteria bacterium RIFCSPHIGHO2_02_FULL_49_9]|uniref:Protein translocase subunit SecA n=2 Tax=Candidatus Wildermuthiibacteriota TaxID=1817923 RepID=A0A1G2QXS9_9BACT|nr:MAG: preprotein translocase subunit SecA [Candidatus Wildermuthbacteria bacterium RIFCSPHIGHO2_01_FULL_49_22b]OHA71376.1 MAG: preprotein translocase subunit SecA [Candidatus Wildermuthbacteria bacterium RIFCSPHIGHO2_02_FULL_49_9]
MANILQRILGGDSSSLVRKLQPLVEGINAQESKLEGLLPVRIQEESQALRERVSNGSSLEDILPRAFALVRETARRTLGQRHFDAQLMGGMVLHEGKIAEMKTGEGKTLAATLPAYLNALKDKGVHVITVNDYLAKRDTVWMGQIYHALGLSVACITHQSSYIYDPTYGATIDNSQLTIDRSKVSNVKGQMSDVRNTERDEKRDTLGSFQVEESYLRPCTRREAYATDITYGTNNEFGFDYLRDNMAQSLEMQVQRGHHYAIIDEVDSVLIDEARTPLIISAPDQESSSWYREFAKLIPQLKKGEDYELDEKLRAVTLTEQGINKVEGLMGVKDIYQERGIKFLHHLEQALKAEVVFERDRDYVVRDRQVVIVDEFTGRLLPGRRYSGGLHQALEAKEGVQVQPESLTLASITFQNYFRMYKKLAGMTGTALTSAEEFSKVYNLEVVPVPTNKPMVRQDMQDRVYQSEEMKFQAIVEEIKTLHEKGQPVLVGTVSIQKNEYLGKLLERQGVSHEMLNAKNHEREAAVIAQAGKKGAVTIATNMAGRGVDIILGGNPPDDKEAEEVKALGGLHVIGTERHEARRIDNQLRGRSGRQGDPGSTQFFVSLQDDLIRIFGGERIQKLMQQFHLPKEEAIESKMISGAIESAQSKIEGFNFDARKHLLEYDDVLNKHRETVYRKRKEILEMAKQGNLGEHILGILEKAGKSREEYEKKEQELGQENMRQAEKIVALRVLDSLWMDHLENMEQLRDSVRLRAYGQQDPLIEYKNEGRKLFQSFMENMEATIASALLSVSAVHRQQPSPQPVQQNQQYKGVGRNDPCPCGSGKKYKRCHGR